MLSFKAARLSLSVRFLIFAAASAAAAKELVLEYKVLTVENSQKQAPNDVDKAPKASTATPRTVESTTIPSSATKPSAVLDQESHSKNVIGLGSNYFYIERNEHIEIYRFDDKTFTSVDPVNKVYSTVPLFALITFREDELKNRMKIRQMLGALGAATELPSDVELQSLFGLKFPGQFGGPRIEKQQSGDTTKFVYEGKVLASYQPDGRVLAPEYQNSFERFLNYCATLYPLLGHRICESGHILKVFDFETNDLPRVKTATTYKLSSVLENELPKYGSDYLKDYTRKYNSDQLVKLTEKLNASPPYIKAERLTNAIAQANVALANNEKFNAFLSLVQCQLETCQLPKLTVPDVETQKHIDEIQMKVSTDPSVQKFKVLLGDGEMKDAEATIAWLTKQDTASLKYGHVIDVWKASVLSQGGDSTKASKLCFDALMKNPYMQFGYYILGYSHSVAYQTPAAWEIWSLGNTVQPKPNMYSDIIDARELRLLKSYPQYF